MNNHRSILKSEGGQAIGIIMVIMTVMAATTAIVLSDGKLTERLNFNKVNRQIQQRSDIAENLANFILYSAALSQSVFDQNCLQNQVASQQNPASLGDHCLLHNQGQSALDTSSSNTEDHSYYPFSLKSPFNTATAIAGTRTNPACYGRDGALCTTASCECVYKAYTMYRQGSVPSLGNGLMMAAGVGGSSDPSLIVKVKVVSTQLADRISQKEWSAETQVRLSEINNRLTPSNFRVCVEGGAVKPGYVKVGVRPSTIQNNGNGSSYEEDICVPSVGSKPCPPDQFQVGLTALGEPVCSGTRNPCAPNQIPIGFQDIGSHNVQIKCMNAECRNRTGIVNPAVQAFGFVSPKATDSSSVSCILLEPDPACLTRPKNSMAVNGRLTCDTQTITQGTPINTVCSHPSLCSPVIPQPTLITSVDPTPGPTWDVTSTPCIGGLCPQPTALSMDNFRPAFASRAMGCISCHAVVKADVFTDFGYNDPWFWGQQSMSSATYGSSQNHAMHNSMYSDYVANGWPNGNSGVLNSMQIIGGNLYIPANAQLPPMNTNDYIDHLFPVANPITTPTPRRFPMTMKEYVETYARRTNCQVQRPGSSVPNDWSCQFDPGATPHIVPIEKNSIYIGAPTAAEIQAVGNRLGTQGPFRWTPTQTINGYSVVIQSNTIQGISQIGPGRFKADGTTVKCDGDLMIDGDLLFKNARIDSNYGCRIYITGHVFINGNLPINGNPKPNLQISSAKSINLGMGKCTCGSASSCWPAQPDYKNVLDHMQTIHPPLAHLYNGQTPYSGNPNPDVNTWTPYQWIIKRYAYWDSDTRSVNGFSARTHFAATVADAANALGAVDASCEDRNRNLTHVLFNAPYIMNRHTGAIKGAMIGEIVMNALANFPFEYDDDLRRVPVLPLLNYTQFFSVDGDNGTRPRGMSVTPGHY